MHTFVYELVGKKYFSCNHCFEIRLFILLPKSNSLLDCFLSQEPKAKVFYTLPNTSKYTQNHKQAQAKTDDLYDKKQNQCFGLWNNTHGKRIWSNLTLIVIFSIMKKPFTRNLKNKNSLSLQLQGVN